MNIRMINYSYLNSRDKKDQLSNQFSELMSVMKNQKAHVNILDQKITFRAVINDINQEAEDYVFCFFINSSE